MSSSDNPQFEPPVPPTVSNDPPPLAHEVFVPQYAAAPAQASPGEDPVWSGWDVLLIAGLTFIAMVVLQVFVVVGALWLVYPHAHLADLAQKPVLLLVSQLLIYIALAVLMVLLVEGKYHVPFWRAIHWRWPHSGWKLLVLGAATFFGLALLQSVLPMPKDTPFEHLFDHPRDAYLLSIIAVTLAPLMEELFFRGFMYPVLARRMGVTWAVLLTALPFGLMHLPQYGWAWVAALVIFLVGVVCGVVRAATDSVAASFLVHVGYNGVQMIIALVYTHGFQHMEKAAVVPYWTF